jgi:hypothetical protein
METCRVEVTKQVSAIRGELFSTVSTEEARIARLELEGQLKSLAISAGSKDKKEARGDFV